MDLTGRVAVVTGAGSGLGRSLAIELAQKSMKLVLAGRNAGPLEATAGIVSDIGSDCLCVTADVSKLENVQRVADRTLDRFGEVHLLCNIAGVGPFGSVADTSIEEWQWILSVNLWGPIHGTHVFLPIMQRQGSGHICSAASESGLYGVGYLAAYNVAKFGVVGLMQTLARELKATDSPVTASVFCPGAMKTNILDTLRDAPPGVKSSRKESEATLAFGELVREAVDGGMDPADAAKTIVDAIKQDQFWIFSHPHVPKTALRQAEVMAADNSLMDLG